MMENYLKINIFASTQFYKPEIIMLKSFPQILLYTLLSIFIFSSCITSHTINYMQKPDIFIPHYKDSITFGDYKLRKGDRVYITVYSTNDKTNLIFNGINNIQSLQATKSMSNNDLYTYLIDENGCVNLPIVGDVNIVGKTVREATVSIEKAIEPLYRFSTVDIKIAEQYFSIIGSSVNGLIQMPKEKINIFQALALAGDIGLYGERSKIRILRETPQGTTVKIFDVRSADIVHSEYFYIEPNDVIYVQNSKKEFFGVTNIPSLFSTVVSTASFAVFLYDLATSPAK